jgi:hypothetical protein
MKRKGEEEFRGKREGEEVGERGERES